MRRPLPIAGFETCLTGLVMAEYVVAGRVFAQRAHGRQQHGQPGPDQDRDRRASRSDRLRVNCTPDSSSPARTSAPAIHAREGAVAVSATQAVTPTTRTRLCMRTEPGQLPRAPYRAAPRADATENPASSGPAQATSIARCPRSAGRTISASATSDAAAAPVR
jgi:hypothetical protein